MSDSDDIGEMDHIHSGVQRTPLSPDYVPGPEHADDEIVAEDPGAEDASPTAQSPDYVPETDLEADLEEDDDEDPEEDPIDYPAEGGDDEIDIEVRCRDIKPVRGRLSRLRRESAATQHLTCISLLMTARITIPEAKYLWYSMVDLRVPDACYISPPASTTLIPQLPILLFTLRHVHGVSHLRILARRLPEYVPDPMELEYYVPVYIPKPEHPEDLVPAEDEAPIKAYMTEVASAPLPPPSFLPSLIRPPRTRAAMAQMRAAAPSNYHPLLPSGTPPLLPIPLPAPSTSRKADIPEADTPPRKRLLLTAPRPGSEVGESSAAAARQPGPTMARKVDCSSVDTMETRVRDTERKMMAALEVVNLRVSYQVDVRSRESSEYYSRHHDAQKDRTAVRAEIEVLRGERLAYEQESMENHQALARSEAYSRALEARITAGARDDTLEDTARAANKNDNDSHTSRTGGRRTERVVRECTYQDSVKCKPLYFKGTEEVVELTQWFKRMETIFRISNCSVENQINHDVAYAMTWADLRKKMTELWNLKVKGTDVIGYNQRFQELALL
ncbi:hypothetical protein Tco_0339193, partial [Tanacetum coccineum]